MWRNDNEPQALFFVRRFYSRTNSFVRIEPVEEKLSCGQQRKINVHYVLNRKGYRNANHTNFYYVVSATSVPTMPLFFYLLLNTIQGRNLQVEISRSASGYKSQLDLIAPKELHRIPLNAILWGKVGGAFDSISHFFYA